MKKFLCLMLCLMMLAAASVVSHQSIERDTIRYPIFNTELCNGCGRCYISCMDGGHQAIRFDPKTRLPVLNGKRCVGCHLCILVCPADAVTATEKSVPVHNR